MEDINGESPEEKNNQKLNRREIHNWAKKEGYISGNNTDVGSIIEDTPIDPDLEKEIDDFTSKGLHEK